MQSWKFWFRKVVTGIAAILIAAFQILGSANMPDGLTWGGYQYAWTEHGMRATWIEVQPYARLEGEVREEQIRAELNRGRNDHRKAAS